MPLQCVRAFAFASALRGEGEDPGRCGGLGWAVRTPGLIPDIRIDVGLFGGVGLASVRPGRILLLHLPERFADRHGDELGLPIGPAGSDLFKLLDHLVIQPR